jgi:peptide/nickel transport system substrate-binding protein
MAKGRDNFAQWSSPEADALIEKGRRTMDPATRMLVWHELERAIAEGQPYTFVRVSPWLRLIKRDFGNVRMYKTGLSPEEYFFAGPTSSAQPGT